VLAGSWPYTPDHTYRSKREVNMMDSEKLMKSQKKPPYILYSSAKKGRGWAE
jgi:hypothetical protein